MSFCSDAKRYGRFVFGLRRFLRERVLEKAVETIRCHPAERESKFLRVVERAVIGYGDLTSYGSTTIHTSNIDRIGSQGVKSTQCYSNARQCTPTRSA